MKSLIDFFFEHAGWLLAVPNTIAIAKYKVLSPAKRIIQGYLILSLLVHAVSYIFWKTGTNNLFFLHLFALGEFFAMICYFKTLLDSKFEKKYWALLATGYTIFYGVDLFYLKGTDQFHEYTLTLSAIIVTSLCIFWFNEIINDYSSDIVNQKDLVLINAGILIYFSCSALLFSLNSAIARFELELRINVWSFHTLLNLIMYTLMSIGLWKNQKT